MYDIKQIMNLAGTNDNDDLETQLDKVAQLYTFILNQIPAIKMDNYQWKIGYINDGEGTKFSKMSGDKEVAWVIIDNDEMKPTYSDKDDIDLQKIIKYMALGAMFG